jgi:hypothetical protein
MYFITSITVLTLYVQVAFLSRKGLMGWACPSFRLSVTRLLQRVQNHMSKGNKGIKPERLNVSQALMTLLYITEARFTYGILHFTDIPIS